MRLLIAALTTALLASMPPAPISAQTAFGILNVWLKQRESADAPNDQRITLYQKSKAMVIGMGHYRSRSSGQPLAEEVAKGPSAQGFEITFKKDDTLRDFFISEGSDPNARLLLWFAGRGDTIHGEAYFVLSTRPRR